MTDIFTLNLLTIYSNSVDRSSTVHTHSTSVWGLCRHTYICLKLSIARMGRSLAVLPRWCNGWLNFKPFATRQLTLPKYTDKHMQSLFNWYTNLLDIKLLQCTNAAGCVAGWHTASKILYHKYQRFSFGNINPVIHVQTGLISCTMTKLHQESSETSYRPRSFNSNTVVKADSAIRTTTIRYDKTILMCAQKLTDAS